MADCNEPFFSIVIPFRGELENLHECLDGIARQENAPEFDLFVVDDGSENPVPGDLGRIHGLPLQVFRQVPLGISAARNMGLTEASGKVVLFVDSDVTLDGDFLENLAITVDHYPRDMAFQGNLRGGTANMVERMENLRLTATLQSLKNDKGYVNYVNTSAFALRKSMLAKNKDLFDLAAVRGEDTKILIELFRSGNLPRFVIGAKAAHRPRSGLTSYIRKHFSIGYYTKPARDELSQACPGVLMSSAGRQKVASRMLVSASEDLGNLIVFPLVLLAHGLERFGRLTHTLLGFRHGRHEILNIPVDAVRENELVAKISSSALRGEGCLVTYLTAWTMVQANRDRSLSDALWKFDTCYPDGMGVIFSSLLLGCGRIHKVTANNFIWQLCQEAALRNLPVAVVGAKPDVISKTGELIRARLPSLNLVACFDGYMTNTRMENLFRELHSLKPKLVIVGMGQPLQEIWVLKCREMLPQTVFLCVGGLFDYICGDKPTPPRWIRRAGFEWLFILVLRPRPFWKRYILGLPALACLIIKTWFLKISTRFSPKSSP